MVLNEIAVKIAVKILSNFEGCNLISYPDPASPLYKALSTHGMLAKYMAGAIKWDSLDDNFQALSGTPWTVGYGQTNGVTKDTVWTQAQATADSEQHVRVVMTQCITDCPKLADKKPEQIAALTSLAYNIGSNAFKNSTAARNVTAGRDDLVPDAIKMFNRAGGKVMQGLVNRRKIEADLYNSGRG